MRVTVLAENTSWNGLSGEHGLSFYIEHNDRKILLDAGSTDLFAVNAEKLGVDLSLVDVAVLSHGHYDHSGGFSAFFEKNSHAVVYARNNASGKFYSANGGMHEISVPKQVLARRERFAFVEEYGHRGRSVPCGSQQ